MKELKPLSGEIEMDETIPISSRAKDTMMPLIIRYTKAGSLYYTDNWFANTYLLILQSCRSNKREGIA